MRMSMRGTDTYESSESSATWSRGEGWGLPMVEAMSMSLPVIATNFSGPTGAYGLAAPRSS